MQPKFVVDINVGRLAKWLRALGYDAVLLPDADDGELVRVALRDRRVILTRDRRMLERRVVATGQLRALLIKHEDLKEQLRQVVRSFGLNSQGGFSRCIRCNQPLAPLPRESAAARVPPYVYQTQREFMECPSCHRVYWRGTHWTNMLKELSELEAVP